MAVRLYQTGKLDWSVFIGVTMNFGAAGVLTWRVVDQMNRSGRALAFGVAAAGWSAGRRGWKGWLGSMTH